MGTDEDYVVGLEGPATASVTLVGGKGAQLRELSRIPGVRVPPGFCVTTNAFTRVMAQVPEDLLEELSRQGAEDRATIGRLSAELRRTLEAVALPDELTAAVAAALGRLGAQEAYAVRSSATAEDLPTASFAGQHDTFLNVVGTAAILAQVRRCWASLFTERAVVYRLRQGIDHRAVQMAVVVQRMVAAQAAGVLFTADPVSGNRHVAVVEAVRGLGEALVSGRSDAEVHAVHKDAVVRTTATEQPPVLTDAQVLELVQVGGQLQARFGRPQDIEWCLDGEGLHIVQSRPITALFPVPGPDDGDAHVYLSVGHQQMMTDPMKPLGLSLFQLTALPTMHEAASRLFVDVAPRLASAAGRAAVLDMIGRSDPLTGDALRTLLERGDVVPPVLDAVDEVVPPAAPLLEADPAVVTALIARNRASVAALERDIRELSGPALLEFVVADIQELKRLLFDPESHRVIMAAMQASWWLDERVEAWLGEQHVADVLSQAVPGNVTSEMGLALLDVADAVRPHPDVVAFLRGMEDDDVLDGLDAVSDGREVLDALRGFLDAYGMRGPGEIDITRPRWSERPALLVPMLLSAVGGVEPGGAERRREQGRREAQAKEQELLERLRALPGGAGKAEEARRMIDRVRTFSGYREYPKYGIVCRYAIYKRALLQEAQRLVAAGVLAAPEDSFFLTLAELGDVVRTHTVDHGLIAERRQAFRASHALAPPRVITSAGEIFGGDYRRGDAPAGALLGLAVSSGTVEGRARVVLDPADATLKPGDILVTAYTDPSWSPLFLAIGGLVTEVGGLMTHGAVIAREYGLPAVVAVPDATRLIVDGQRIRVHGAGGYVELLP